MFHKDKKNRSDKEAASTVESFLPAREESNTADRDRRAHSPDQREIAGQLATDPPRTGATKKGPRHASGTPPVEKGYSNADTVQP